MTRNIYIIIFTFFLFSCSENNPTGYVGQPVTTTIDLPDESEDLEFLWELTSIPSKSFLININKEDGLKLILIKKKNKINKIKIT